MEVWSWSWGLGVGLTLIIGIAGVAVFFVLYRPTKKPLPYFPARSRRQSNSTSPSSDPSEDEEDDFVKTIVMGDLNGLEQLLQRETKNLTPASQRKINSWLHFASRYPRPDVIQILLKYGADPNHADKQGHTPVHYAARNGHTTCLQTLLATKKCNIDGHNKEGKSAAHWAALNGRKSCLVVLKDYGANFHLQSNIGTPAHCAALSGHMEALETLLDFGVPITITDTAGNTLLHAAAVHGNVPCLDLLVKRGATFTLNKAGSTPLDDAALKGYKDFIIYLVKLDGLNCKSLLELLNRSKLSADEEKNLFQIIAAVAQKMEVNSMLSVLFEMLNESGLLLVSFVPPFRNKFNKLELPTLNQDLKVNGDSSLGAECVDLKAEESSTNSSVETRSEERIQLEQIREKFLRVGRVIHLIQNAPSSKFQMMTEKLWLLLDNSMDHLDKIIITSNEEQVKPEPNQSILSINGTPSTSTALKLQFPSEVSTEQQDILGTMLEVFHLINDCKTTSRAPLSAPTASSPPSSTPSSSSSDDRYIQKKKFIDFVLRHQPTIRALSLSNQAQLTGSLDFILENVELSLVNFRDLLDMVSFEQKRSWLKRKLNNQNREEENISPLEVIVSRSSLLADSCSALSAVTSEHMMEKIAVKFIGEEGTGAGVRREWLSEISKEMFNPNYALFKLSADQRTFYPNPTSYINPDHLSYFSLIGKVLACSIALGHNLDVHFTRPFYKQILSIPVSFDDLQHVDLEYCRNLSWILENDLDAYDHLELTFSAELDNFGTTEVIELKPQGSSIAVTNQNKKEYVHLLAHHKLTTSIQQQITYFLEGFHQIIPHAWISVFNEFELELLISGLPEIDEEDWKRNTNYVEYTKSSPQIDWFWEVVKEFTDKQKAQLLQFVSGSSRVPLGGFSELKGVDGPCHFTVAMFKTEDPNALPSASTCFNLLKLPPYISKELLRNRLSLAVDLGCQGFGFV